MFPLGHKAPLNASIAAKSYRSGEKNTMAGAPPRDLVGLKFGRLTVRQRHGSTTCRKATWLCHCECGAAAIVRGDHLRTGDTRSCGCLNVEVTTARCETHGLGSAPEYSIWQGMIHRCSKNTAYGWSLYGGRGIKVCSRWRESFEAFYEDMGPRPTSAHSIERNDVNGNYEPSNCRWATRIEQANNRRNTIRLEMNGRTLTLAQLARDAGLSYSLARSRHKRGLSAEDIIRGHNEA